MAKKLFSKIFSCSKVVKISFSTFLQMPFGEILEAIKVFQPNLSMVATLIRHPNPDQYIKIFSTIFKYLRETHLIHIKVFQPNLSMVATLIRHPNPDQNFPKAFSPSSISVFSESVFSENTFSLAAKGLEEMAGLEEKVFTLLGG